MIWGNQDQSVGRSQVEAGAKYVKGPYKFVELDAGHWLIQDEESRVTSEILEHIKSNPIGA
jgi:surfactin synthase thioesterase subunit